MLSLASRQFFDSKVYQLLIPEIDSKESFTLKLFSMILFSGSLRAKFFFGY